MVTLAGRPAAVQPTAGTMLVVRFTVPLKEPIAETVIVEVPLLPTSMVIEVGLALTEKSAVLTLKVTTTECDRVPLVPVTLAVKVPATLAVQDRVALPGGLTPAGDIVQLSCGLLLSLSATGAPNPLTGLTEIVEDPVPGGRLTLTGLGLALIVKSTNWKLAVVV